MKSSFPFLLTIIIIPFFFSSCGDDDNETPSGPSLGDFSLTITDGGNETSLTGEADYRGSSGFINNTTRHIMDLNPTDDDAGDILVNILLDRSEGVWQAGAYPLGRISPVSNIEPPVAEFYFVGSDTYKFVDNSGTVTITEITEDGVRGSFDVSIQNDVTGNFARFKGSFFAED
ncbi:MAG: hypothetical protein AAF843_14405 [Bacteroidota bacterium]